MSDDAIPVPPAADAYMRRNDPEHIALITDMKDMKGEIRELRDAAERVEKRLLGEYDDVKREWRPGVLQEMQQIHMALTRASKALMWFGGILTAVMVSLVSLAIENFWHLHLVTSTVTDSAK